MGIITSAIAVIVMLGIVMIPTPEKVKTRR